MARIKKKQISKLKSKSPPKIDHASDEPMIVQPRAFVMYQGNLSEKIFEDTIRWLAKKEHVDPLVEGGDICEVTIKDNNLMLGGITKGAFEYLDTRISEYLRGRGIPKEFFKLLEVPAKFQENEIGETTNELVDSLYGSKFQFKGGYIKNPVREKIRESNLTKSQFKGKISFESDIVDGNTNYFRSQIGDEKDIKNYEVSGIISTSIYSNGKNKKHFSSSGVYSTIELNLLRLLNKMYRKSQLW